MKTIQDLSETIQTRTEDLLKVQNQVLEDLKKARELKEAEDESELKKKETLILDIQKQKQYIL